MPTSHQSTIGPIIDILLDRAPMKILDLGIGFGKWGALMREYLDWFGGCWEQRDFEGRHSYLVGVEVYEKYRTPLWQCYDKVFREDIFHFFSTFDDFEKSIFYRKEIFDMTLLLDILEHFTREDGFKLLDLCLERSQELLICTPLNSNPGTQKFAFGNKYEEHKSQWHWQDFEEYATLKDLTVHFTEHERALIVLLLKK